MKDILFKIRMFLMPSELKKGSWFFLDGDFYNMDDFWYERKKGKAWSLPIITIDKESNIYFGTEGLKNTTNKT